VVPIALTLFVSERATALAFCDDELDSNDAAIENIAYIGIKD